MLVTLYCVLTHTYYENNSKLYIIADNPKPNPKHTPLKIKVHKGSFCNDDIEEPFWFHKEPFVKRTTFS